MKAINFCENVFCACNHSEECMDSNTRVMKCERHTEYMDFMKTVRKKDLRIKKLEAEGEE